MKCPECGKNTLVKDSRELNGNTNRRRECQACGYKFNTIEIVVANVGKGAQEYESHLAICPFYLKEDTLRIHCEGVNGETVTHVVFNDNMSKKKYKKEYCYTPNYKQCRFCIMLYSKYPEQ